uniref:Putative secreted protein n=1 Tax=Ixodes ricinus TaxID=34613 RepID=A0A6B0V5G4_IXORI
MKNNLFCLACVCVLLPAWAEADSRQHSSKQENAWTMKVGLVLDVAYRDFNKSSFRPLFKAVEDYFVMDNQSLLQFAQICAPDLKLQLQATGAYNIDGMEAVSQLKNIIASNDEYKNLDFVFLLTGKGIQVTYNNGIHLMSSYFEVNSTFCQRAVPVIVSAEGNVEEIGREIARTLADLIGRKVGNDPETHKQCLQEPRVSRCCEWAQICVFLKTHCEWRPELCSVAWAKPCVREK